MSGENSQATSPTQQRLILDDGRAGAMLQELFKASQSRRDSKGDSPNRQSIDLDTAIALAQRLKTEPNSQNPTVCPQQPTTSSPQDMSEWKALCMESIRTFWTVNEKLKGDLAAMSAQMQTVSGDLRDCRKEKISLQSEKDSFEKLATKKTKALEKSKKAQKEMQSDNEKAVTSLKKEIDDLQSFQNLNRDIVEEISSLKLRDVAPDEVESWIESTAAKMESAEQEEYWGVLKSVYQTVVDRKISKSVIATQCTAISNLEEHFDEVEEDLYRKRKELRHALLGQVKRYYRLLDWAGIEYDIADLHFDEVYETLDQCYDEVYDFVKRQDERIHEKKKIIKLQGHKIDQLVQLGRRQVMEKQDTALRSGICMAVAFMLVFMMFSALGVAIYFEEL